jgi:hypothetical protein
MRVGAIGAERAVRQDNITVLVVHVTADTADPSSDNKPKKSAWWPFSSRL